MKKFLLKQEAQIFHLSKKMTSHLQITSKNFECENKTIHEGQRNYNCNSCEKSFTQSGHLKRHIKGLHEGQRNCKCDSCGKSYTQSGHLKLHIKTLHEGTYHLEEAKISLLSSAILSKNVSMRS